MSYIPRKIQSKDGVDYEICVSDTIVPPNMMEDTSRVTGTVSTWMRKVGTDEWVRTENPRFMEVVDFITKNESSTIDKDGPEKERVAIHG